MEWNLGPPVLIGEKVLWSGNAHNQSQIGTVRWLGKIPEFNCDWCVGVEFEKPLLVGGNNGFWKERRLFECHSNHGLIVPMNEINKISSGSTPKQTNIDNHLNLELDDTQFKDFQTNFTRESSKKNKEARHTHHFGVLESKFTEWSSANWTSDRRSDSDLESKNNNQRKQTKRSFLNSLYVKQPHLLKVKNQNEKLLLRKRKKKKNDSLEKSFKRSSKTKYEHRNVLENLTNEDYLKTSKSNETSDSKVCSQGNMNDVAGYFKEIKEDDKRYEHPEIDNSIEGTLSDVNCPGNGKEKKFFSFLKWFKKNKGEPNLKLFKESSAASSPMFPRKRTSSCESVDTLFSTQTVRSFAYIPPIQYEPSAPPAPSLLDFDKTFEELANENDLFSKVKTEETEEINERRKKRKAPEPPRLSRENSLPSTLEHRKSEDELSEGAKTYHRRTVSESFKDKKAGAYCHVQGKKKAPLPPPPPPTIYPNLEKINNPYPSLYKKKKPAPPPPCSPDKKNDLKIQNLTTQTENGETLPNNLNDQLRLGKGEQQNIRNTETNDLNSEQEEKKPKSNQYSNDSITKEASLSPLPSRPWYKRSHRDSNGSNIIKKDLLKAFERKKNKETDDGMPEVGFSRRSFSTDITHNKFNIFSRLDKSDEKKKEEKRKSQISILTNISELDREAAEIVKKEQAEEKKMLAANDARYYSPENLDGTQNKHKSVNEKPNKMEALKPEDDQNKNLTEKNEFKNDSQSINIKNTKTHQPESSVDLSDKQKLKTTEDKIIKPEKYTAKEKNEKGNISQNSSVQNPTTSINSTNTYSNASTSDGSINEKRPNAVSSSLNYFNIQNKEVNYLNEPWVCQKCTLENPGWRVFCEICSSVKPRFLFNKFQKDKVQENNIKEEKIQSEPDKVKETEQADLKPLPSTVTYSPEKNNLEEEEPTKESAEEIQRKRMEFFNSKIENNTNNAQQKLHTSSKDFGKIEISETSKEIKENSTKNKSQGKILSLTTKKDAETETDVVIHSKDKLKNTDQNYISTVHVYNPTNDAIKYGAIKKKPTPQPKKEETAEAYIITKTIVLEDFIIKKGEKSSGVVDKEKSNTMEENDHRIRPPPRTKKVSADPVPEVKPRSNRKKVEEPLDLSPKQERLPKIIEEDIEALTNKLTQAEGLADFKANIEAMPQNTEMNTVAVNRLLRKLETAINCGDHYVAAGLAKELALLKINCSVKRQNTNSTLSTSKITLDLYIEDKLSHKGPIPIQVSPTMTLLELKNKVQQELRIPKDVQRWILNKRLATDDNKTLESHGVTSDACPVFLYLVAPGKEERSKSTDKLTDEKIEHENKVTPEKNISDLKTKGLYYNFEEDHYSHCEDSDDDSKHSYSDTKNISTEASRQTVSEDAPSNLRATSLPLEETKTDKSPVVDLNSRNDENELEKELKVISVNSVKQKVEKLNRTFAENRQSQRIIKGQESWKCVACTFINPADKFHCSACNAKKSFIKANYGKTNANPLQKNGIKSYNEKQEKTNPENMHYKALIELQDTDLVPNAEPFTCSICMTDYLPGEGVTLKDCLHTFCRTCLISTVEFSEDAEVKCPYLDEMYSCTSVLQQREIKALVPRKIFELHLAKSVKEAENKMKNTFHCKTPDCKGWCIFEDNVNDFNCPVCKMTNCLTCHAIHTGINCKQYQEKMKNASDTDINAKKTREMLEEMVEKGEALVCPKCQVVLMKKWGCDWLRCSMCKTEICWVTRGFRWGPAGKGDTSGGCKCGVNGVKCHPKCNYCH